MNMLKKMLPYLLLNFILFYLLPLIIIDTSSAFLVVLVLLPLSSFIIGLIYGYKWGFNWLYGIIVGMLFYPTIFIHYNSSAWGYAFVYGLLALGGDFIGKYYKKR
ncbi:MAG: hypothetical protein WBO70_07020 [Erysipelotrichaceae bacterium]